MRQTENQKRAKSKLTKAVKDSRRKRVKRLTKKHKMITYQICTRSNRITGVPRYTGETVTHHDKLLALAIASSKFPNRWVSLVI